MARAKPKPELTVAVPIPVASVTGKGSKRVGWGGAQPPFRNRDKRGWIFLLLSTAVLLAVLWWHWNRGWEDLESDLQENGKLNRSEERRVGKECRSRWSP